MKYYPVSETLFYCNVSVKKCSKMNEAVIGFYDLTLVLEGEMTYTANGETFVLKKNDAILLKPDTVRGRKSGNTPVHYVSFNFLAFPDASLPFDTYIPDCINTDIHKLLQIFPSSHLSSSYHSKEKCANMLNYILFELSEFSSLKTKNIHIIKMIKYIDEHITEKLTLGKISKEMNLSKEYTSYIFSKEMGKTITDYINERKLLLARELISSNEKMSLSDIASHLGFDNYNYFSRIFKQKFGISAIYFKKSQNKL